jgi:threonine synthase
LKKLFVKDDTVNPSASLKDRASSLCVVKAVEAGAKAIITASTGNAAASLSAFGASAGLKTIILVPCSTQRAKLAQIMVYGANLIAVRATYDCTFDLSVAISLEHGIYLRSTAVNPFCVEGKKTVSFEIWEQMDFNLPDYVIVPAGDGCIISGVYKGFYDLKQSGLTEKIPKIIGVQSEGSAAIAKAFERNLEVPEPVKARTIADSISVDMPRDGVKALRAARESGGFFVTVTDNAILKSIPLMARLTGIFPEPASAASLAGLKKLVEQGRIQQSSTIVLLATGSGLKDTENAIRSSSRTIPEADPDIKSIEKLI